MLYGCWYGRHPEAFFDDDFDRLVALAGICIVDVAHPQQPIAVFGEQFFGAGVARSQGESRLHGCWVPVSARGSQ